MREMRQRGSLPIIAAAFSAIMTTGTLVLPDTSVGMMPQSTTRRPAMPMHAQLRIDDGCAVVGRPHPRRAARMEDRSAGVPRELEQRRRR